MRLVRAVLLFLKISAAREDSDGSPRSGRNKGSPRREPWEKGIKMVEPAKRAAEDL